MVKPNDPVDKKDLEDSSNSMIESNPVDNSRIKSQDTINKHKGEGPLIVGGKDPSADEKRSHVKGVRNNMISRETIIVYHENI